MVKRCQAGRCCTQTCHFLMMHIARVPHAILLAEVTGISAGSHDYSKLVASLPRSTVGEYLVETSESVPKDSPDPLSEPKQVIVAVSRGEGDVGSRTVIEFTYQNSIWFSVLNA